MLFINFNNFQSVLILFCSEILAQKNYFVNSNSNNVYVCICMYVCSRRSLFTRTMIKNKRPFKRKKYFSFRKWDLDLDLSKDEKRKNKRYSYQLKDWGCYTKPFSRNLCWSFVVPSRQGKCQVLYVSPYPNLDACLFLCCRTKIYCTVV